MYTILLSKKVVKFIKSLPVDQQKIIKSKFELLKTDPYHHPKSDLKKMKSQFELYRLRIGRIRFIYEVKREDVIILVFAGGMRGDIYKNP
jgi:mRNA-degrading endonuclease RelE of RelBE toxin-antitoxin system